MFFSRLELQKKNICISNAEFVREACFKSETDSNHDNVNLFINIYLLGNEKGWNSKGAKEGKVEGGEEIDGKGQCHQFFLVLSQ